MVARTWIATQIINKQTNKPNPYVTAIRQKLYFTEPYSQNLISPHPMTYKSNPHFSTILF
jgi:hypothetical protein